MKRFSVLAACTLLAACGSYPGPSVPSRQGADLQAAREAVRACEHVAEAGGRGSVTGNYIGSVLWGGLLLGPIIVATNEDGIRASGEAAAVDRCLAKQGFKRRDLTPQEVAALNRSTPEGRRALLDHLVRGGALEGYAGL